MKIKNIFLSIFFLNLAVISLAQAKDLHCRFPIIGNTKYCADQAEIDNRKREAKAEAKATLTEAKSEAQTIKKEAKEQAKQITTAAKEYKKGVEAQVKETKRAAQTPGYSEEERHWYNLWRFWDMKKAA